METLLSAKVDTIIILGVSCLIGFIIGVMATFAYARKVAKDDAKIFGKDDNGDVWR